LSHAFLLDYSPARSGAGVHIINLSFGEYANLDNTGRFTEMCQRAVDKHGVIFVTSAGNNGPALTTGGAPGT